MQKGSYAVTAIRSMVLRKRDHVQGAVERLRRSTGRVAAWRRRSRLCVDGLGTFRKIMELGGYFAAWRRRSLLCVDGLGTFRKIMELGGYFNFKVDCQQLLLFFIIIVIIIIAPQGDALKKRDRGVALYCRQVYRCVDAGTGSVP